MKKVVAGLISLILTAPALARLISIDDLLFGPGSITRDTETGLDWLDLPITQGFDGTTSTLSHNDVIAQLGPAR